MTTDSGGFRSSRHTVRCPICLDEFVWEDERQLYERIDTPVAAERYRLLEIPATTSAIKRRDRELDAWKRCPDSDGELTAPDGSRIDHYLPEAYAKYGRPLVIGFVGFAESGKSHLLASMVGEIEYGRLETLGLDADPVDAGVHQNYLSEFVDPLFNDGEAIQRDGIGTSESGAEFKDAFLLSNPDLGVTRAVTFFDISGEILAERSPYTQFILAMDALIFVVDPDVAIKDQAGGSSGWNRPLRRDNAFATVLHRFRDQEAAREKPVAIAITKCDRWRFEQPVSSWLRRDGLSPYRLARQPDLAAIWAESADAFAFLHQNHAQAWLRPYSLFSKATLHFVSATGSEAVELISPRKGDPNAPAVGVRKFARGVRPKRVLDPLAAILAMSGMLGDEARTVGGDSGRPEEGGDR
ncbi:hypothetical protein [Frankia sp. Cj5]|uniref:hypothetical protein n=1 Tax=Frankia sp. Cj5 TaxID=2880978 RepID=UPI001EF54600|nr:hypothetical protein [Frankia sp. Cj5]